ncbi:MAG: hypothetical protein Hals2KO_14640 [Halioglobus sp.]
MEFLTSLPKILAEIGYKLFSLKRSNVAERKEKFANLVEQISECVNDIGLDIREGRHVDSQCAELSVYLEKVGVLAAEIADQETATALTFALYYTAEVPGFAKIDLDTDLKPQLRPSWFAARRFERSSQVLNISGELRAIANLLRL